MVITTHTSIIGRKHSRYPLSQSLPINKPYQHAVLTSLISIFCQYTLSMHPLTLPSTHPVAIHTALIVGLQIIPSGIQWLARRPRVSNRFKSTRREVIFAIFIPTKSRKSDSYSCVDVQNLPYVFVIFYAACTCSLSSACCVLITMYERREPIRWWCVLWHERLVR